jgi:hypothetical protein
MLLFVPEALGLTTRIVGASKALFTRTARQIEPIVSAGQATGELRADLDVDELAQWLTRLVLGVLMVPGDLASGGDLRGQLERYLAPALTARAH